MGVVDGEDARGRRQQRQRRRSARPPPPSSNKRSRSPSIPFGARVVDSVVVENASVQPVQGAAMLHAQLMIKVWCCGDALGGRSCATHFFSLLGLLAGPCPPASHTQAPPPAHRHTRTDTNNQGRTLRMVHLPRQLDPVAAVDAHVSKTKGLLLPPLLLHRARFFFTDCTLHRALWTLALCCTLPPPLPSPLSPAQPRSSHPKTPLRNTNPDNKPAAAAAALRRSKR